MGKVKPQISTDQLIKRLHLMADTGGMLTRDRIEAVRQVADRLSDMRDAIATQQAADAWNESQEVMNHEEH